MSTAVELQHFSASVTGDTNSDNDGLRHHPVVHAGLAIRGRSSGRAPRSWSPRSSARSSPKPTPNTSGPSSTRLKGARQGRARPKVAGMLDAKEDLMAFTWFPMKHWRLPEPSSPAPPRRRRPGRATRRVGSRRQPLLLHHFHRRARSHEQPQQGGRAHARDHLFGQEFVIPHSIDEGR